MSSKDKKLLIMLVGILFMALSYFTMYRGNVTKAENLRAENATLSARVSELEAVQDKCPQYESDMETMNAGIEQIIDQFPVYLREENNIMDVVHLEDETNVFVSSLTIADPVIVDTSTASQGTDASADAAEPDAAADAAGDASADTAGTTDAAVSADVGLYKLFDIVSTVIFDADYDGMKDMVSFIAGADDPMSVEQISMTFNSANGLLSGTMDFNTYYLFGQDKAYVPAEIPAIPHGVDNIFGQMIERKDSSDNSADAAQADNSDSDAE